MFLFAIVWPYSLHGLQPTMVNRSQPFNTNFSPLAPDYGAGQQHNCSPPQLPAPPLNMQWVTQGGDWFLKY